MVRMAIFLLAGWLGVGLAAAQLQERPEAPPQPPVMRDEDEDILPQTEYAFNPVQAKKDLKIGDFYWKKGNHRAAAARYLEATRWNPGFGDAYWKLAEAREKLKQPAEALDAYRKYLDAEPDGRKAGEAKKRIAELEQAREKLPLAASETQ
jgi:tetratricopeptide (TPR) repeat protein